MSSTEIPNDFPVRVLVSRQEVDAAGDPMQCGTCGRWWDDAIATTWTPVPAGRCPFEHFHEDVTTHLCDEECGDDSHPRDGQTVTVAR